MMKKYCHYCHKVCNPEKPDPRGMPTGRFVCTKHPSWVWHNESRLPEDGPGWTYVYFAVDVGTRTYGFGIYPRDNALRIVRYDKNAETGNYERYVGSELNIRHIPKNLTPENAKEKLPFYLTFW